MHFRPLCAESNDTLAIKSLLLIFEWGLSHTASALMAGQGFKYRG